MTDRPFGAPLTRPSKYRSVKTVVGDVTFDSKAEARRWSELLLLERGGVITELVRQPQFAFFIGEKLIFRYIADFKYFEGEREVIEDVKGVQTPVFRLKRKLIEAQFGIKITVTG